VTVRVTAAAATTGVKVRRIYPKRHIPPPCHFITRECGVECPRSSVCLSVCLFVNALTFESLDLERSFLGGRYVFGGYTSSSYMKIIGSRSRSQEQKSVSVCRKSLQSETGES